MGWLRTFDHFSNVVLENCIERIYVGDLYGDVPLGLQIIRGENIVLLGELDASADEPPKLRRVDAATILQAQKSDQEQRDQKTKILKDFLHARGLVPEGMLDDVAT